MNHIATDDPTHPMSPNYGLGVGSIDKEYDAEEWAERQKLDMCLTEGCEVKTRRLFCKACDEKMESESHTEQSI